jgi:hypothetical protein
MTRSQHSQQGLCWGGGIATWSLLALLLACSPAPAPDEVARSFWEAIRAGDLETARGTLNRDSALLLDRSSLPDDLETVLLGEVLKNERAAIVRTSASTAEHEVPMKLVFHTHLVLEDERWKVDLEATREEVERASMAAGMQIMSDAIGEGIQELGEALERGADEVGEAIREALEGSAGERI